MLRGAARRSHAGLTAGLALALLLVPVRMAAAQETEPAQLLSVTMGWGRFRPVNPGFAAPAADGDASAHIGVELESRYGRGFYLYARARGDASEVRQHLSVGGGLRLRPRPSGRYQPFAGAEIMAIVLVPSREISSRLERTLLLGAGGSAGVDWVAKPDLRFFAEYRLDAARYLAVGREPGCGSLAACLVFSRGPVLHLGHALATGLRLNIR